MQKTQCQLQKSNEQSTMDLPHLNHRTQLINPNPNSHLLLFLSHHLQLPPPFPLTFPSLLSSTSHFHPNSPFLPPQLHSLTLKLNPNPNSHIYNSLIHLYSSSHLLIPALQLFDQMPDRDRDVVTYTTIISAAVNSNRPKLALELFKSMRVPPNDATIVTVLRACSNLGALSVGRTVHRVAAQLGIAFKPNVVSGFIDMYSKCGRIDLAERIYERIERMDCFSWTAMIGGLASHGRSLDAIALFDRMGELGLRPDEKTITAVLSACRSLGLVCEGYRIFNHMGRFGMKPKIQHYGCMVDLLARAGQLSEAEDFIRKIPIKPDSVLWRNLIWASRFHGDMERVKRLIEETRELELDSGSGDGYILKGNVYALDKNWEEKARVREVMVKKGIKKLPGCSRIEVKGVLHEFEAGDSKHPKREQTYRKWDEIAERLTVEGYKPKFSEVLLDIEDEEKASQLNHHSERLALAFGLINTRPGEEILIVKNLRACEDCHNATKFVSKIYDRKIVIRDRIKFHHFSNGSCSCGDYW